MTEDKIKSCPIPTDEIKNDIEITQKEIEQFESELKTLYTNPPQNKLEIYMREGKIAKRKDFISKLTGILKARQKAKELIDKFKEIEMPRDCNYSTVGYESAKQSAIICADQILFAIQDIEADANWDYWLMVKAEIENL